MYLNSMVEITQTEFDNLSEFIKVNYGIRIGPEKQALLVGRLQGILQQKNISDFSRYYQYVISDKSGEAVITLLNKITTNHTFFMREFEHFNYLKNVILPNITQNIRDKDLRIWSSGCSSGEEPYTIAMILADYFGSEKTVWDSKILATDLSTHVLEKAKGGLYANDQVTSVPDIWKMNYFKKASTLEVQVSNEIRNEVVFRRFNLMDKQFPFKKKFHVIFCRNVMIYFDAKTKAELIQKFYDLTEPGGYLLIGQSEALNREETEYKYIKPSIYRKI